MDEDFDEEELVCGGIRGVGLIESHNRLETEVQCVNEWT